MTPGPSKPETTPKALAERAKSALDVLGTWEDEASVFDATMMAIADVQRVVRESGESAHRWDSNKDLRDDVLAFLRTAHKRVVELRSKGHAVFDTFSLHPHPNIGSETYSIGGASLKKIDRNTPLSLLLQTALIAHMVIFARANRGIKGTIFQNPERGEFPEEQKLARNRYIEGMLVGLIENLNTLGWDTNFSKKAAVNTIVRHQYETTNAFMSGEMIRDVLKSAGDTYAKQSDKWIAKKFNYGAKISMLVGNPASLENAILAHATSALFLDDKAWIEKQLEGLNSHAKTLALDAIQYILPTLQMYPSEKSLQEGIRKIRESAEVFADEKVLKERLQKEHGVAFSGSISSVPWSLITYIVGAYRDSLTWFAGFLRGEAQIKYGRYASDEIRARLQPRILDPDKS